MILTNNKVSILTEKYSLKIRSHRRETKRKRTKSYFYPLSRTQNTLERSCLTIEKDTQYLSIICENHIFKDPTNFL